MPKNKTDGYRSTRVPPGGRSTQATPGTPPDSPGMPPMAPSNSPATQTTSPAVTLEGLRQLLLEFISVKSESLNSTKAAEPDKPDTLELAKAESVRASKLEFITVNEFWDKKESAYEIIESVKPAKESDKLDEYVFVVRMRIDRKTGDPIIYIDIKSESLQKILTKVLYKVKGICLGGDRPTVERNLLYNYLPELEAYRVTISGDPGTSNLVHLDLLINHIKEAYESATQRLTTLLKRGEITYDLLWALFKPSSVSYTTCSSTKKSRCFRYDFGEEKTMNGVEYFHIEGRYYDLDGEVFGEATVVGGITKFHGAKPIRDLGIFPFKHHENMVEVKAELIKRGRKFISLRGTHHCQYKGRAFRMENGNPVIISVDSRIMVDATVFRKMDPNYVRPSINVPKDSVQFDDIWDISYDIESSSEQVKSSTKDLKEVDENDLLLCSPTVLGFSLNDKKWLEFAIDDITDITWNTSLFDHLAIKPEKKTLIRALTKSHISEVTDSSFDDIVVGKGRGLIMLLYGPPGVGKTLTAEGLSEDLQRPLYMMSAGELSNDTKALETQLSQIFELANHWKALLLLDEADVYFRERAHDHLHNSLISVFLRKLEYSPGLLLLTTNRIEDFDSAILSRTHITLKYDILGENTRMEIWKSFLEKAATTKGEATINPEQLEKLAQKDLNGREIKNLVRAAHALAMQENTSLSYNHLEIVVELGKEFEKDFREGQKDRLNSYA